MKRIVLLALSLALLLSFGTSLWMAYWWRAEATRLGRELQQERDVRRMERYMEGLVGPPEVMGRSRLMQYHIEALDQLDRSARGLPPKPDYHKARWFSWQQLPDGKPAQGVVPVMEPLSRNCNRLRAREWHKSWERTVEANLRLLAEELSYRRNMGLFLLEHPKLFQVHLRPVLIAYLRERPYAAHHDEIGPLAAEVLVLAGDRSEELHLMLETLVLERIRAGEGKMSAAQHYQRMLAEAGWSVPTLKLPDPLIVDTRTAADTPDTPLPRFALWRFNKGKLYARAACDGADGGVVLVVAECGAIGGIDTQTGRQLYRYDVKTREYPPFCRAEGRDWCFVASDEQLLVFEGATGRVIGRYPGRFGTGLVVSDDGSHLAFRADWMLNVFRFGETNGLQPIYRMPYIYTYEFVHETGHNYLFTATDRLLQYDMQHPTKEPRLCIPFLPSFNPVSLGRLRTHGRLLIDGQPWDVLRGCWVSPYYRDGSLALPKHISHDGNHAVSIRSKGAAMEIFRTEDNLKIAEIRTNRNHAGGDPLFTASGKMVSYSYATGNATVWDFKALVEAAQRHVESQGARSPDEGGVTVSKRAAQS